MANSVIRILIVEDNDVIREGFVLLINSMSGHKVVGAYNNCEDAVKKVRYDEPDVILMDLDLPGISGIEGIRQIKKIRPESQIIVITVSKNSKHVFDSLVAGACGYILKSTSYTQLLDAIQEAVNGGAPMSSGIARMVVESFQKNTNSPLSARETEVLELLSKGKRYSIIADELFIHKETVKSHIKNIYAKLQVNSKAAAIDKALKNKLI